MSDKVIGAPVDTDTLAILIGEGVHTGLRKGVHEADGAPELWDHIHRSISAWSEAVHFAAHGLEQMGYRLVKVDPE